MMSGDSGRLSSQIAAVSGEARAYADHALEDAKKWVKSITFWGQKPTTTTAEDGTETTEVKGNMTGVGTLTATGNIQTTNAEGVRVSAGVGDAKRIDLQYLKSGSYGLMDNDNDAWLIGSNGANSFLMTGNVGVGTESPAYKLDVNGVLRVRAIRIGDALLTWDSTNQAIKIERYDGQPANVYSTGGVTSLA